MGGGVCPVSGESLLGGQTISRTAVARVGTAVSDLPELLADLDYVAGGLSHGDSAVGGGVPSSKEPVNLSLVLEVWEAVDLLAEWANALLVFVTGPKSHLAHNGRTPVECWCPSFVNSPNTVVPPSRKSGLMPESLGGTTMNRKDQAMSGRRVRTYTVSATSAASTIPRPMSPEPVMENVM